jgi:hypothetical protein
MKPIIGVIHLKPLPGAPMHSDFTEVLDSALKDARALEEGGVDALLIENFGDKPFFKTAPPETVACMTAIAKDIAGETSLPLGINVLRNDAIAALAIAKAVDADFIRVNQLIFPSLMPEGFMDVNPGEVLRYRKQINCRAMIFADVSVKHSVQLAKLEDFAENFERSLADAVVITGSSTGSAPDMGVVSRAKKLFKAPVLVGSGVNAQNVSEFMKLCDGVIVGTYLKKSGRVEIGRVRNLVRFAKDLI